MVPEKGLEPLLAKANGILNPARLPIPPLRQRSLGQRELVFDLVRGGFSSHAGALLARNLGVAKARVGREISRG